MTTRVYLVTCNIKAEADEQMLVEAHTSAQALRHALKQAFSVRVANTKEVAAIIGAGGKLEIAD